MRAIVETGSSHTMEPLPPLPFEKANELVIEPEEIFYLVREMTSRAGRAETAD